MHRARPKDQQPNPNWSVGRCECGKQGYQKRAAAKETLRRHKRWPHGGVRQTVYRCPIGDLFHVGGRDPRFIHPNEDNENDQEEEGNASA